MNKYNRSVENKLINKGGKNAVYRLVDQKTGKSNSLSSLISSDHRLCTSDKEKSDLLAEVFSKVYSTDNGKLPPFNCATKHCDSHVLFDRVSIENALNSWPQSFSVTPDGIPFKFIKEVVGQISEPLEFLFTLSMIRCEVPKRWKHSLVTPIPKKAPFTDPNNYRPISITSIFARLFEKILKKHMTGHLDRNKIISEHQHGFRKGKSVETQMLECVNDWTNTTDKDRFTDVVYFDFSKAFDRVSHPKLLYKLRALGFHNQTVNWLEKFLLQRTFQVKVKDSLSDVFKITSGVPQGGAISPLLFSVYTCEVPSILVKPGLVSCKVFADDTKIYQDFCVDDSKVHLQESIDSMYSWSVQWELPLSVEKTKVLHIGNKNPKNVYTVNGTVMGGCDTVRDLGFTVTSSLTFADHCKRIVAAAKRRTYNMFKTLKLKNKFTWIKVYKTYIRPIVESGCTVFNSERMCVKAIESVQNDFTRKLFMRLGGYTYCKIPSAEFRNKKLGLQSLEKRRNVFDLIMVHKIVHGNSGVETAKFYTFENSRTRGTRLKLRFTAPKFKTRAQFFTVRAGSKYLKITKNKSVPVSVKCMKKYLFETLN